MDTQKNFCCQGEHCSESCCGEFNGFSDQLISIEGRDFKDIILTSDDIIKLKKSAYKNYIFVDQDGLGRIKTNDQGVCSALKDGKCQINDLKPTICRCFPLYLDAFVGLCSLKRCPAAEKTLRFENYINEIEPLLDMYEFWISYYRKLITTKEILNNM